MITTWVGMPNYKPQRRSTSGTWQHAALQAIHSFFSILILTAGIAHETLPDYVLDGSIREILLFFAVSRPAPGSTQPSSKSKQCYDRRSVGQSVLVSGTHPVTMTRFLLLSESCGFVDVVRPLWWEDGSLVYSCCWASKAHSFWDPSSGGLVIFYCLKFESPQTLRYTSPYLYASGTAWPSYTPRHQIHSLPPFSGNTCTVQ
jgi:hypothetical protein